MRRLSRPHYKLCDRALQAAQRVYAMGCPDDVRTAGTAPARRLR